MIRSVIGVCGLIVLSAQIVGQNYGLMPIPKQQFFDAEGSPLARGRVYTCAAGSSCPGTPLASYSDSVGTPNANPVILDTAGRTTIYLGSASYKIVVQDASGVTQSTQDNVRSDAVMSAASISTSRLNNIRLCDGFSGANAGAKIIACIADLPATGGVADARGFEGTQTATSPIVVGSSSRPVELWLSPSLNLSTYSAINVANGSLIRGGGVINGAGTTLTYSGGPTNDWISVTGVSGGESRYGGGLERLNIVGTPNVNHCLTLGDGTSKKRFDELYISGCDIGLFANSSTAQITHNIFERVLFAGDLAQAVKMTITRSTAGGGFIEMNTFIDCQFRNRLNSPQQSTVQLIGDAVGRRNIVSTVFINPDASFSNGQPTIVPPSSTTGTMFDLQRVQNFTIVGGEIAYDAIGISADANSFGVFVSGTEFFGNNTDFADFTASGAAVDVQGSTQYAASALPTVPKRKYPGNELIIQNDASGVPAVPLIGFSNLQSSTRVPDYKLTIPGNAANSPLVLTLPGIGDSVHFNHDGSVRFPTGTGVFDGALTVKGNLQLNNSKGQHIATSANSDTSGRVVLSGGSATLTFTTPWTSAPVCVGTDTTNPNPVQISTTTTFAIFTGTATDVISYICMGNPN